MRINIFPIVSSLHEKQRIDTSTKLLLDELESLTAHTFNVVDIDKLYDETQLSLILIQSGGSEQLFLNALDKLKPPFYLLTYGNNNSLAASLEILSFIKDHNLDGEVLHGSNAYLAERINSLIKEKTSEKYRFGIIGKPSDWLIASNINYQTAYELYSAKIIDIPIDELIEIYDKIDINDYDKDYEFNFDEKELENAKRLYLALRKLVLKYDLNGLTIRCFDLLSTLKTTSCLGLSLLNNDNIVATCEGDQASMISMHILNQVASCPGFQANPSRIDIKNKKMVLAHCTLPLNMCESYKLDTHFESGIGVAIKGEFKEEKITIFKLSKNLKDYFVTTGTIIKNLNENNLCRSQIEITVDENIEYFLNRPYGNHHIIVYGDYKDKIISFMKKIN